MSVIIYICVSKGTVSYIALLFSTSKHFTTYDQSTELCRLTVLIYGKRKFTNQTVDNLVKGGFVIGINTDCYFHMNLWTGYDNFALIQGTNDHS